MGYLVCDSCQGCYELKSGESPDDFLDECHCGGTLNFKESVNYERVSNPKERSNYDKNSHEESTDSGEISKLDPRILRLTIGVLVVLIPNFLYSSPFNILFFAFSGIPLIIGGFISSIFTEKRRYMDGILNGARVGLFSAVIYLIISLIITLVTGTFVGDIITGTGIFVLSFLVLILFTSLGGLLGIGTRQLFVKLERRSETKLKNTSEVIEAEDVIEIENFKEMQEEEYKYRDELVKLGFKQMTAINDGEKVFNCLLSDSISENEAIMRLQDDQKIVYEVLEEMKKITPPERYREYHNLKMESSTDICKTFEIIDGLVKNDPTKIQKTNTLVETSTIKINQAITELHKTMWEENPVYEFK